MLAGQLDTVLIAAAVGGVLNLRLGRTHEAVADREMQLQVDYQRAVSEAEYDAVRESFLELADRARSYGEKMRELTACGFAIQAGYFGAQVTASQEARERWIRRSLTDMIKTLRAQPGQIAATDATRLIDFMYAPLDMATGEVWAEQATIGALLREVSREIDAHVGTDVPLSNDPQRDAAIAVVLDRMNRG